MDNLKALIAAATHFPFYPELNELHVTTDEQVFADVHQAIEHAIKLCSGNPQVFTVNRDEIPVEEELPLTKAQAIEKAEKELAEAVALLNDKTKELGEAPANKKGVKQAAANKASLKVDECKLALESAIKMED